MFGLIRRRCSDCGCVLKGRLCQVCDEPEPGEARYISRRSSAPGQDAVEIGVLVDRTGSSAAFSKGVVVAAETILCIVEKQLPGTLAWVQSHGDEDYEEVTILLTGPLPVEQGIRSVRSIRFGGGGDAPETHLSAIESAIDYLVPPAQDKERRQAMLVFLTDDTKPARSGRSAEEIGRQLKELGVLLYLICEPTATLRQLCQAADGLLFEISNKPSEEMLHEIASQIAGSVYYSVSTRSARPVPAPMRLLPPATA